MGSGVKWSARFPSEFLYWVFSVSGSTATGKSCGCRMLWSMIGMWRFCWCSMFSKGDIGAAAVSQAVLEEGLNFSLVVGLYGCSVLSMSRFSLGHGGPSGGGWMASGWEAAAVRVLVKALG